MKSTIANLIDEEILNCHHVAETEKEFISRICQHLSHELSYLQRYSTTEFFDEIWDEIEDQVLEVYRIKTYGYPSLKSYKATKLKKVG